MPTVSAGPDQSLCFPGRKLSLFGRSRDDSGIVKPCVWSAVSGPAPVRFSAPWAEATSAAFTVDGSYTLRITSQGLTDDVNVTVVPESSQTKYYVDPSAGGSNSGTEANPWTNFDLASNDAIWSTINTALASGHVIVYFSATATQSAKMRLWRSDTSTNRLTLDGMSKYNSGGWSNYFGGGKFTVAAESGFIGIGVEPNEAGFAFPLNYVTIRGFRSTGSHGRMIIGGNNVVAELNDIYDVDATPSGSGPSLFYYGAVHTQDLAFDELTTPTGTVTLNATTTVTGSGTNFQTMLNVGGVIKANGETRFVASIASNTSLTVTSAFTTSGSGLSYQTGLKQFGNCQYITFRENTVARTADEGIYIGGNYQPSDIHSCPIWKNTHQDVLLEDNVIDRPGFYSGQGDAIDLKAGLINVTVRGNRIYSAKRVTFDDAYGITSDGIYDASTTKGYYLVEGNRLYDTYGLNLDINNSVVIRNNVLWGRDFSTKFTYLSCSGSSIQQYNYEVYNNTLRGAVLSFGGVDTIAVKNNNVSGVPASTIVAKLWGNGTNLTADYNLYQCTTPSFDGWSGDANAVQPSVNTVQFRDPTNGDFNLVPSSPAANVGTNLSSTGLLTDIEGRPRGSTWDIGAHEYAEVTLVGGGLG